MSPPLVSVEEEHDQVSRELDRLPRQADMEARLRDLNRQLDDLRDEIRKVYLVVVVVVQGALLSILLQRSKDIQHCNTEMVARQQRLTSVVQETVSAFTA